MSTREDYPAGVPCWVDTNQPDPADAARFYSGLFGWQTEDAMPPDAGAHYYMARLGGGQRAWRCELQQPAHRRCPGRSDLLRRRVRLDDNRRRLADVGSAGLRRPSRGAQPRL